MEDRLVVLSRARLWAMSSEELLAALDSATACQNEATALKLGILREIEARCIPAREGASSTPVWVRNRSRVTIQTARREVSLATALDSAPAVVGEGIASGAVNLEQAEAILRALQRLPREVGAVIRDKAAAELVGFCADLEPAQLRVVGERILLLVAPEVAEEAERRALAEAEARAERDRHFTMTPDPEGSGVRVRGRLTAEGAAVIRAAMDPLCRPVPSDTRNAGQRRADAIVDVCRLALSTTKLPDNGGDRPQVVLGVQFDVLKREIGAGTLDNGEQVTPQTARRMACDAQILPIVFDGHSQPLDVARTQRLFKAGLRKAIVARDHGCTFPGCDRVARWCDGHHVVPYWAGGPTSLDNAALLCPYHHSELHKPGGWTMFIAADGLPTFIPPRHVDPQQRPRRNRYHR